MIKIKDRFLLGALGGTTASFVARLLNRYNYAKGLTDIRYNPLAARLFLDEKGTKSRPGIILGEIVNGVNTAVTGIMLVYILSATGRDKAIIKGIGIGLFSWIMVDGLLAGYVFKIKSKKPISPLAHLAEHLLYGVICAKFITCFGDNRLFPAKEKTDSGRIPLIDTGHNSEPSLSRDMSSSSSNGPSISSSANRSDFLKSIL